MGLVFVSTKILFASLILIYFGGTQIICNEDIPVCDKQLKQLKEDAKDWERRCVFQRLGNITDIDHSSGNRLELNSRSCLARKEYLQDRMRMHSKTCFYDGKLNYFLILLALG